MPATGLLITRAWEIDRHRHGTKSVASPRAHQWHGKLVWYVKSCRRRAVARRNDEYADLRRFDDPFAAYASVCNVIFL